MNPAEECAGPTMSADTLYTVSIDFGSERSEGQAHISRYTCAVWIISRVSQHFASRVSHERSSGMRPE